MTKHKIIPPGIIGDIHMLMNINRYIDSQLVSEIRYIMAKGADVRLRALVFYELLKNDKT